MKRWNRLLACFACGLLTTAIARAQDPSRRLFGAEFEFAGVGNRHEVFENQRFENFRRALEVIVRSQGGNVEDIRRIEWQVPKPGGGERTLYRAEWTDRQGRSWKVEPEFLGPRGLDGYEVVTPPLTNPAESERVLEAIRSSGVLQEGLKSGSHIHIDARDLVTSNGRADALINSVLLHERYEPLLRELFNPVRGSGVFNKDRADVTSNRFARSLALDHPGLLEKISQLPSEKRTKTELERIFREAIPAEMKAHGLTELDAAAWKVMWKYRSLNLVNTLNINDVLPASKGTIEFRMNDLAFNNPANHRLQVELYKALVEHAKSLATRGEVVEYRDPRTLRAEGEDPIRARAAQGQELGSQLREMIETLGLDPKPFETLIERAESRPRAIEPKDLRSRLAAARMPETGSLKNLGEGSYELRLRPESKLDPLALESYRARLEANLRANALSEGRFADAARAEVQVRSSGSELMISVRGASSGAEGILKLAAEQISSGRLGPWKARAPSGETLSILQEAERFLTQVEGKTLSEPQRELLNRLQSQPELASLLRFALNPGEVLSSLPERLQRDLRFRNHDILRTLLSSAEAAPEVQLAKAREALSQWARETRLSSYITRSLMTDPAPGLSNNPRISAAELRLALEDTRATLEKSNGARSLNSDLKVEITDKPGSEIVLRDGKVLVSAGLLQEIHKRAETLPPGERAGFRRQALSLALAEPIGKATGLSRSEAQRRVLTELQNQKVFSRGGRPIVAPPLANSLARLDGVPALSSALREAPKLASLSEAERASIPDPYKNYRRSDGTLKWTEMGRDGVLKQGAGVAHFALALFLKELAVVVKTGDRLRIEEFFDGLATTDFFVTYGLFAAGAQAGNVAYSRYVERFIKPGFVNGILKTNIVLATGMALPEIAHGTFDGKAFAIDVASLGLSTAAVKAGVGAISWVSRLDSAENAARLARAGANVRRLAKVGGWFYTAAETAVVLYLGDEISSAVNRYLDDKAASKAIGDATISFLEAAGDPKLDEAAFQAALDSFDSAHVDFRNYLYKPVIAEEQRYLTRLQGAATEAKRLADKRAATLARLEQFPALKEGIIKRYGSIDNYSKRLLADDEASIDADVQAAMRAYERSRNALLNDVYTARRRGSSYLDDSQDASSARWLANGARPGAAFDPASGGSMIWDRWSRDRSLRALRSAAGEVSFNRLQAYDDQLRSIEIAISQSRDPTRKAQLGALRDRVRSIKESDEKLIGIDSRGAAGALGEGIK